MANTSLAYDYSSFAPAPSERNKAPQPQKPRLRMVRSQPRAFAAAFSPRILCAFFVVVTLVGLIVYNQACMTEVTSEISALSRELEILESESVRYASLLESTVSLRAIAQQAEEEMGMGKLDQYQTEYVYLYAEDQIILAEQPEQKIEGSGLLSVITSIIGSAKEYISSK